MGDNCISFDFYKNKLITPNTNTIEKKLGIYIYIYLKKNPNLWNLNLIYVIKKN